MYYPMHQVEAQWMEQQDAYRSTAKNITKQLKLEPRGISVVKL